MRYFKYAAIVLLVCQPLLAYDVRVDDGQIIPSKYLLGTQPVYSDTEKAAILARAVDTGTGTVIDSSFVTDTVSALDQGVINELNGEGLYGIKDHALREIFKRTSRAYNLQQISFWRNQYLQDMAISSTTAFDMSATTAADIANFNRYRLRFIAGTH